MSIPVHIVRLAIEDARRRVSEDPQLPLTGALSFACANIEHTSREATEALYKAAKLHVDQAERLFVLDVALELLPKPEPATKGADRVR